METVAIISYSSYHNAFIERCVEELWKAGVHFVLVISHDHFYDGKKDDALLTPRAATEVVPWTPGFEPRHYHNELRKIGYEYIREMVSANAVQGIDMDFDSVFFIDSDEILDGARVKEWLENVAEVGEDYKLAHFWYYRDTCYRADQIEEGAVLVSKQTLEGPNMDWFGPRERENYSKKWRYKEGYKGKVLGHHYSWAGTKEMLTRKIESWGHNKDMDWKRMIDDEFSHGFEGCPFRPNYTFKKIEPYVGFTFETT